MYDCNLIKSRTQKMQDFRLPSLESSYQKTQLPGTPTFPMPILPMTPNAPAGPTMPAAPLRPAPGSPSAPSSPAAPSLPPRPPEAEESVPRNPLLPRVLPTSPNIAVPKNPLLPPEYASVIDYEGLQYLNGFLRTQIGNYVEVEFLVGSTNITIRYGKLVGVGLNYILLEDLATGDVSACDFYNIKFCRTHAHGDITHPEIKK